MKIFRCEYKNDVSLARQFKIIKRYCKKLIDYKLLFHISVSSSSKESAERVISRIETAFPDALFYGDETFGNIYDGKLSYGNCNITCSVFEEASSDIELVNISMADVNGANPLEKLWNKAKEKSDVKAIEIISSFSFASKNKFMELYVDLPEDVKVFGGVSANMDNPAADAFVFAKNHSISNTDCVAVIYSGPKLNFVCDTVSGWKGLGRWMNVTKSSKNVISEIDNEPAFNIYTKYLGIDLEKNVFANQSWFPLVIDKGGFEMIRCVAKVESDGSLVTLLDVDEGTKVRLAYGDHSSILIEADKKASEICDFKPDLIKTFSCAARRLFWGDNEISNETKMFAEIAETNGFYTAGELLRIGNYLYEFNSTIVLACMREGEKAFGEINYTRLDKTKLESTLSARLVSFVTAVTSELEEQYEENYKALITDALTGISNRYSYEVYCRQVNNMNDLSNLYLVSCDVNGLKTVNDSCGHNAGDELIVGAATVLENSFGKVGKVFRIGGDEYVAIIFCDSPDEVKKHFADEMESWHGEFTKSLHISMGIAGMKEFPGASLHELEKISDKRMYEDKEKYYTSNNLDRRTR